MIKTCGEKLIGGERLQKNLVIAKELKFRRATVRDILKKFISTGSIERKRKWRKSLQN